MRTRYGIATRLRSLAPSWLKALIRRHVSVLDYDVYVRTQRDPFANDDLCWMHPGSRYTVGIILDLFRYHKNYIQACRELGVSYKVLDIMSSSWVGEVEDSGCDAFLVWPSAALTIWKDMFDDRLQIMETSMNKIVYPTYRETWLYENKRRAHDWLTTKRIPHPRTWVFYRREEAIDFVRHADLPLVLKASTGASGKGVYILRERRKALAMVRQAFARGILVRGRDPRDREWGSVYLQEYLPNVREWRMVRIGDSYFGHLKLRRGDFHSGSGLVGWDVPSRRHLDFLRWVTEMGKFTSMDVDVFEAEDGRLLVNELQCVFGAGYSVDQLRVDGEPGRFIYDETRDEWAFQAGDFARNACANARLDYLIHTILPHGGAL